MAKALRREMAMQPPITGTTPWNVSCPRASRYRTDRFCRRRQGITKMADQRWISASCSLATTARSPLRTSTNWCSKPRSSPMNMDSRQSGHRNDIFIRSEASTVPRRRSWPRWRLRPVGFVSVPAVWFCRSPTRYAWPKRGRWWTTFPAGGSVSPSLPAGIQTTSSWPPTASIVGVR